MKIFLHIVVAILLFSSCDLTEKPYTIGEDNFGGSTQDAQQIVTGAYEVFWTSFMMKKTYMEWVDMDHDHACAHSWVLTGAGSGNVTTHWGYNNGSDLFFAFYRIINRTNFAIEKLPTFTSVPSKELNQLVGESLFLRAFSYFHLVRMYGPVPLRLDYITSRDMPRSPVKAVYEQIVQDLERSAGLMEEWGTSASSYGHANKMAAKLLLAKVYATMGSTALAGKVDMRVDVKGVDMDFSTEPVEGSGEINANACYEKVETICNEIIARRGQEFDMQPSFLMLWGGNNARNKEFVWAITGGNVDAYTTYHLSHYYSPIPYNARGWAGITTHAYDLYDDNRDERAIHGVFHYFQTQYSSINTYGYYRFPDDAKKYPIGPNGKATRGGSNTRMVFPTKWYTGDIASPEINTVAPGYAYVPQDVVMLRYAEAYLLRAEALNELDRGVDLALDDLDQVRKRSKASMLKGTTADKKEIRSLVMEERAMELMQEFNRKFDLLRWGLYLKVMNAVGVVNGQGSGTVNKVREPRCKLYAVPTDEVYTNKLFGKNNDGWN